MLHRSQRLQCLSVSAFNCVLIISRTQFKQDFFWVMKTRLSAKHIPVLFLHIIFLYIHICERQPVTVITSVLNAERGGLVRHPKETLCTVPAFKFGLLFSRLHVGQDDERWGAGRERYRVWVCNVLWQRATPVTEGWFPCRTWKSNSKWYN
jgi:hypothetical protein